MCIIYIYMHITFLQHQVAAKIEHQWKLLEISPCELGGEGCDLWYSTRKRHALRLRIFSSLENHKLHKSAHPSIQGKSDITTPLILVKKINKASNELSRKSLSLRKLWRKDEPKTPVHCEPLAERLWFFILTD